MSKTSKIWAQKARYDLETAESMLREGRFIYVLFCCQQSIEKILKALLADKTSEMPPRIHNLPRLVEFLKLDLPSARAQFLGELSDYYIQSRYPDEIELEGELITKEQAVAVLDNTKEAFLWLSSLLR
jgi:HEPN domain-containing protein